MMLACAVASMSMIPSLHHVSTPAAALPRACPVEMALFFKTSIKLATAAEPETEFQPFKRVRAGFARVKGFVNRKWRSEASITDAILTANMRSRATHSLTSWESLLPSSTVKKTPAASMRDVAEISWEERCLPELPTLRSHRALDAWEDRVLPTGHKGSKARNPVLDQMALAYYAQPPLFLADAPRVSIGPLANWEDALLPETHHAPGALYRRASRLAEDSWEDRCLPALPDAKKQMDLAEDSWEDRLLP